jgi:DNA-binding CsgD family transcriptional regulator/5-methylcytosine-specific restriction endonuclease McrA
VRASVCPPRSCPETALRVGIRRRCGPPPRYDWAAIKEYYETGHTARECRERFGFSPGAWDQAISRGAIVPRPEPDLKRYSHRTRNAVRALLQAGRTQAQVAAELGLSKGTVAFHVRNLGVRADSRFARRYDWTEIQQAYDTGLSAGECGRRFGFSKATWSQAVVRGAIVSRPREMPLAELLVAGTKRGRYNLKARLIRAGLKENQCERCGISVWMGAPLNMQLHHINGDGKDNRLENLELLCGNCHSQTPNYGGRNGHRRKAREAKAA